MNPPKINRVVTRLQAYHQVMAFKAIGRRRRRQMERGQRGTAAGRPMDSETRAANYRKQNGGAPLTLRQLNRLIKKARRAYGDD